MNGARLLLEGLFDYAGLFPPAGLSLAEAVERYASYRAGPDAWMLGRFVVPIEQCGELERVAAGLPDAAFARPWGLAVLGSGSVEDDRQTLADFTVRQHGAGDRLRVDAVEVRVASPLDVRRVRVLAADGWPVYCEPTGAPESNLEPILDAIAIAGLRAKLRAGGVTAEQIPSADSVARRLAGCVQRGISLKATAGLHHGLTGDHALTTDSDGPRTTMHGYLNLLVAAGVAEAAGAAAVRADEVVAALARLLRLRSRPIFTSTGVLEWPGEDGPITEGPLHDIAASARALLRGIGTCSFEEPVADARALGLV